MSHERYYDVSVVTEHHEVPLRYLRTRESVNRLLTAGYTVRARIAEIVTTGQTVDPELEAMAQDVERMPLTHEQRAMARQGIRAMQAKLEARAR